MVYNGHLLVSRGLPLCTEGILIAYTLSSLEEDIRLVLSVSKEGRLFCYIESWFSSIKYLCRLRSFFNGFEFKTSENSLSYQFQTALHIHSRACQISLN